MGLAIAVLGFVMIAGADASAQNTQEASRPLPESQQDYLNEFEAFLDKQQDSKEPKKRTRVFHVTDEEVTFCHHGCPPRRPGTRVRGQSQVTVRFVEDWPKPPYACPAWQAFMITRKSRNVAAAQDIHALKQRGVPDRQAIKKLHKEREICRWDAAESLEKRLLKSRRIKEVGSLNGPLYNGGPDASVRVSGPYKVPHGYWKVLSVQTKSGLRTAAFILDSPDIQQSDLCVHLVTIDEIEARIGLNLFPSARDDGFEATLGDLATQLGCDAS